LQTIENSKVKDETMVAEGDHEVAVDEEDDEFAGTWALVQNIELKGNWS
jgi:hypothetical protein